MGVEVVDDLSEDAGPVDGVYGSEAVGRVEEGVGEEGFDGVLHTYKNPKRGREA